MSLCGDAYPWHPRLCGTAYAYFLCGGAQKFERTDALCSVQGGQSAELLSLRPRRTEARDAPRRYAGERIDRHMRSYFKPTKPDGSRGKSHPRPPLRTSFRIAALSSHNYCPHPSRRQASSLTSSARLHSFSTSEKLPLPPYPYEYSTRRPPFFPKVLPPSFPYSDRYSSDLSLFNRRLITDLPVGKWK